MPLNVIPIYKNKASYGYNLKYVKVPRIDMGKTPASADPLGVPGKPLLALWVPLPSSCEELGVWLA